MTARRVLAMVCAAAFAALSPAHPASAEVTASSSTPTFDSALGPAAASAIGSRLGALMGVETASLAGLSRDRIRRLGAPFSSRDADGRVMNAAELDRMGRARGNAQWRCLTEAIYFEARGESIEGQYAVAEVILNRVDHANYPRTICAVVNEGTGRRNACQFSYTCDGIPEVVTDQRAWNRAGHIARIMMEGAPRDLTRQATHYHADWVSPNWARVYPRTARYGQHIFYRQQYR
jgi:hypothetical protein